MTRDWTTEAGLAELERLREAHMDAPEFMYERQAYERVAGQATPALVAEVKRLRGREAVLVGLLREALPFVRAINLAGSRIDLEGRIASVVIDALTPGGNDGR